MKKLHKSILVCFVISFVGVSCAQDTQKIDMRSELGDSVKIIEAATSVAVARLKVISAADARKYALKDKDRIAGYPLTGSLSVLNQEDAMELKMLLLDNNNYISPRIRCKNEYLLGIRFFDENHTVEFALGMPCKQAIWAFSNNNDVKIWGAILTDNTVRKVQKIIKKNGDNS